MPQPQFLNPKLNALGMLLLPTSYQNVCVCVCVCVYEQTLDLQLLLMLFCSTLEDAAVVWQVPLPHTPSSPPDRPFFLLSLSISLYLSPQPPSLLSISSPEVLCCSLHVQVRKRV